jgi:hypothetical protein
MEKFAEMRVEKWCEEPMKTEQDSYKGQWVLSHVKYLRSGDRFRSRKWGGAKWVVYLATSDPYLRLPEKKAAPSLLELATNPEAIQRFDKPEPPYWTVNFVKER